MSDAKSFQLEIQLLNNGLYFCAPLHMNAYMESILRSSHRGKIVRTVTITWDATSKIPPKIDIDARSVDGND